MKHSKTHPGSGISLLLAAAIAILALARGPLQTWLLSGVFILWGLRAAAVFLLPRLRQSGRRRRRRRHAPPPEELPGPSFRIPEAGDPAAETLLLRHVNHRISAYLKSAYPDATWEWQEKKPERLALSGGTGRIRVFGVPDFGHADITIDTQANITCSMVKIVPLPTSGDGGQTGGQTPPNRQPVDPQVWYELQGRTILESLVADLNSRGHSHLTLHENGDACVEEGQGEVKKENLAGFPEKMYWPRLVQVLEGNGLAAEAAADGIRVSW